MQVEEPIIQKKFLTVKELTLTTSFQAAQSMETAEIQAAQLQTTRITSIPDRGEASGVDKLTVKGKKDTTERRRVTVVDATDIVQRSVSVRREFAINAKRGMLQKRVNPS